MKELNSYWHHTKMQKFIPYINWLNENNGEQEIVVLLPGSYKPMTYAHKHLISLYSNYPNVKEVKVLIGSGIRNGITQNESYQIAKLLLKDLKNVSIEISKDSPVLTAYEYIQNEEQSGIYALGGSKKGTDYDRVIKFVKDFSPSGKYYNLKSKDVQVIELLIDANPILYKGRIDEYEGKPISASILRRDVLNNDYKNFKTNYPNTQEHIIKNIWDILKNTVKESYYLFEGGNIFENTFPIKKENIESTIQKFKEKISQIFPKVDFQFEVLGSAGKKEISNDIDLALSEQTLIGDNEIIKYENWGIDKDVFEKEYELARKRARTASERQSKMQTAVKMISKILIEKGILSDPKKSGANSLFCMFPQYDQSGKKLEKNVQIDVNIGDVNWLRFSYYSESYEGNVKGLHRTQLIVSMFVNKKRIFRHGTGIYNAATNEYEARTPQEVIDLLNELYDFKGVKLNRDILNNFFKLHEFLIKNLSKEELYNIYDIYLRILDSTRTDIPYDIQEYWIKNRDRLELQGKFLPEDSNLIKYAR